MSWSPLCQSAHELGRRLHDDQTCPGPPAMPARASRLVHQGSVDIEDGGFGHSRSWTIYVQRSSRLIGPGKGLPVLMQLAAGAGRAISGSQSTNWPDCNVGEPTPSYFDQGRQSFCRHSSLSFKKENIVTEPEKTIEDRVRERAYDLWERDGRPDGRADEYWQQARSEVEAEDAEPGNETVRDDAA